MCEKNDSQEQPSAKEIYPSLVDLVIHAQDNKLNLFGNFLFFQSILLLAWATVWQIATNQHREFILGCLSVFGILSSIAWAFLEEDYAHAGHSANRIAVRSEKHLPLPYRALTLRDRIAEDF
jgi:hypothetical protein